MPTLRHVSGRAGLSVFLGAALALTGAGCASTVSPTNADARETVDAAPDRPIDDRRLDVAVDTPRADLSAFDASTDARDATVATARDTPRFVRDVPDVGVRTDAVDVADVSDVTEDLAGLTACAREDSEWWSPDDDGGLVACALCRCRAGAYRCAARSPDTAPRVTPEYVRDAAPTVPRRAAAIDEGLYQLVGVRWYGAPTGTAPTTQELAEVANPPASHTYIALSTRVEGRDEVTRALYFTRVATTGAMIPFTRYCPADVISFRGVTYDVDDDGFTLYLPDLNDAGESVQARTYRRAP